MGTGKKIVIVVFVLVSLSNRVLMAGEAVSNGSTRKSVAAGVLFGALGLTMIPGSYGWGNFYAKDYKGSWILNLGGSAFTVIAYGSGVYLLAGAFGGEVENTDVLEMLVYAGFAGAYGFGLASAIWGGVAVDKYNRGVAFNDRVAASRNQLSCRLVPTKRGLTLEIAYRY